MEIDINLIQKFNTEMAELTETRDFDRENLADGAVLPFIRVKKDKITQAIAFLKEKEAYSMNYLNSISGVHIVRSGETGLQSIGVDVVYHLYSMSARRGLCVKAFVEDMVPSLPTIDTLYRSANWFEREIFDLFGVHFEGSRDERRIMLPPDWVGFPLRKDYKEGSMYNNMPTTRPSELEAANILRQGN